MSSENFYFTLERDDHSAFAQLVRGLNRYYDLKGNESWHPVAGATKIPEFFASRAEARLKTPERSDKPLDAPDVLLNCIIEEAIGTVTREGHNVASRTLERYRIELEAIRSSLCGLAAQASIDIGTRAREIQQKADHHRMVARRNLL